MTSRVLITGLNGFTGQYLKKALLNRGYDVCGLTLKGKAVNLLDAHSVAMAVASIKPTHVVHLAAISFVAHADVDAIYQTNVLGTRNLLQALSTQVPKIEHVLVASSATVYGNQQEGLIAESAWPKPANDYAVSKLAMEHMLELWRHQLPITVVRPFNYVGIGQAPHFVIPKIVQHFRQRTKCIELGNLEVWREYNDVRWVAEIYARLLLQDSVSGPLNIATGHLHSLQEILQLLCDMTGHEPEIAVNPAFVRANEIVRLGGDPARLNALDLDVAPVPIEETLQWMLACE